MFVALTHGASSAAYEYSTIHTIVNTASILHVSFVPSSEEPFPTTLPMIGQMGSFSHDADPATEPLDLYIHGYISSRLMRLPEPNPSAHDSQDDSSDTSLPVCVSATHLDGIVLAYTPFHHSMNYRSAVLHGFASPVTEAEEKLWAMQLITNGVLSGRWENSRVPPMKVELQSTQILKVRVVSASAKIRTGGPSEDRKDLKDEEMRKRVWTGVVPVWETWGSPVSAKENMVERVPEHVLRATDAANGVRVQYAKRVISGDE